MFLHYNGKSNSFILLLVHWDSNKWISGQIFVLLQPSMCYYRERKKLSYIFLRRLNVFVNMHILNSPKLKCFNLTVLKFT